MQNFRKNVSGITLISLVVTIIVLLILAGISIAMLNGDNGILQRSIDAKEKTEIASAKEQVLIAVLGSYSETTKLDIEKLKSNLEITGATVIGDSFPVTATISGKKYTIESNGDVQELNENVITIAELQENASIYFGYDVINYAETLPIINTGTENEKDYTKTNWQLFYAGALDGETEGRIYLISKEYIKNTLLPEKNNAIPIATDGSEYKAKFATYQNNSTNISDGILPQYTNGSNLITENKLQRLNKNYFEYLANQNINSTNPNMMAVAYMMDTEAWKPFAMSTEGYAEYAIGAPTVELLFTAYNKYKNKSTNEKYMTQVISKNGYQISNNGGTTYVNYHTVGIIASTDNPYSVSSYSENASACWLASPANNSANNVLALRSTGVVRGGAYDVDSYGFRPIILLNSTFQLEKTKDLSNNDAFKIVEK